MRFSRVLHLWLCERMPHMAGVLYAFGLFDQRRLLAVHTQYLLIKARIFVPIMYGYYID